MDAALTTGLGTGLYQTINVQLRAATDHRGTKTWGACSAVQARVRPYSKLIKDAGGEMRQTSYAILTETTPIPLDARIWLPEDAVADPVLYPPDSASGPKSAKARSPVAISQSMGGDGTMTDVLAHYKTMV